MALSGYLLVMTVTSGRAKEDVFVGRYSKCRACKGCERDGEEMYCGKCGCPEQCPNKDELLRLRSTQK